MRNLDLPTDSQKSVVDVRFNTLPELVGTPRQIAWAQTIREQMHRDLEQFLSTYKASRVKVAAIREAFRQTILSETSARWFIDNRDLDRTREILSKQMMAWMRQHRGDALQGNIGTA